MRQQGVVRISMSMMNRDNDSMEEGKEEGIEKSMENLKEVIPSLAHKQLVDDIAILNGAARLILRLEGKLMGKSLRESDPLGLEEGGGLRNN